MTLRLCLTCNRPHPIGYRCPKREAIRYAQSKQRRSRGTANWKTAREAARERDGNQCRKCNATKDLEVHHLIPISEGGDRYSLTNLITLCNHCHHNTHREAPGTTQNTTKLPPHRFSRSFLKDEGGRGTTQNEANLPPFQPSARETDATTWRRPMKSKWCTNCRQWLPLEAFAPKPELRSGFHGWCRECCRARTRQ